MGVLVQDLCVGGKGNGRRRDRSSDSAELCAHQHGWDRPSPRGGQEEEWSALDGAVAVTSALKQTCSSSVLVWAFM